MTGLVIVILMIALVTGAELWSEERATEAWQWKQDVKWLVKHGSGVPAVRRMRWTRTDWRANEKRRVRQHQTLNVKRTVVSPH